MKRYHIFLLLTVLAFSLLLVSCRGSGGEEGEISDNIQNVGTEKNDGQSMNELVTVLQSFTNEEIAGFYHDDYDRDGTFEAYAITSHTAIPKDAEHSGGLGFWFVKKDNAELLFSGDLALTPRFFDFPDKILACIDVFRDGGFESKVYFVSKNYAHSYGHFGARLVRAADDSYDFYLYKREKDVISNSFSDTLEGVSEKPYYLYFDGNFFVEYGAVAMREDQLRALSGADAVLSAISEGGYRIDSVYRRGNGIININISRDNGNGTVRHENVTLLFEDGAVKLVPTGENDNPMLSIDNTSLSEKIISQKFGKAEEFSYHGSYKSALIPEIAEYPEDF